jgi:hypothetical protein
MSRAIRSISGARTLAKQDFPRLGDFWGKGKTMVNHPNRKIDPEFTAKFLQIAELIKAEAGVTIHRIRKSLYGLAHHDGSVDAPEGRTRKQLYILAHECAHIALKHTGSKLKKHVRELQAEQWAHAALRRHGVPVPKAMTKRARGYVARKIRQAGPYARIELAARRFASPGYVLPKLSKFAKAAIAMSKAAIADR